MKHILLIEDEADLLRSMRLMLTRHGYHVSTAEDGDKGLKMIARSMGASQPIDLIVTDIMMPGLSGLEVISELRAHDMDVPVLAATGHGNKDMVVELMRLGCQDYLDKPFKPETLLEKVERVLDSVENREIRTAAGSQATTGGNGSGGHQLKLYRKKLEQYKSRFQAAKGAYENLAHLKKRNCRYPFSWRSRPLHELGGDFVDVQKTENGCDILVADVSGHDMGASYHTVMLKALSGQNARLGKDGQTFFKLLNRQLLEADNKRMITALFVRLDTTHMKGEVVCAGHPSLVRMRKQAPVPYSFRMKGNVLGILETAEFEKREFNLRPGDRYFLYTDGVTDVSYMDSNAMKNQRLTDTGLDQLFERHCSRELDSMIQAVWSDTLEFCSFKPNDDMLLMGLEIPEY
jgi:DNA-binding response OmpR family regulator